MTLKKEIAQRWYDALVSGDYGQVRGMYNRTHDDGRTERCCLGVLHVVETGREAFSASNLINSVGMTSKEISKYVGLNDEKKLTFPEIAEHVKKDFIE